MHITKTIITSYGRRLATEPAPTCLRNITDRANLARRLDTRADIALAEGDFHLADALSWRAAGLREAAP